MASRLFIFLLLFLILSHRMVAKIPQPISGYRNKGVIVVKTAIHGEKLTPEWKEALITRMSRERIDSFGRLQRPLSDEEMAWKKMIEFKATTWNTFRDSLAVPFAGIEVDDTIVVLLGYLGDDDGFTFSNRTVCLDITALYRAYGKAGLQENRDRIDRIFAHEYTHLLHKEWARKEGYTPVTFKDSILWECWYEGIGMYRSLHPKWLPANDTLPGITKTALAELYPVFVDRMITVETNPPVSDQGKEKLRANLSRGSVNKKWGAFPVAIWIQSEAKGDDKELIKWVNKGPVAVIQLARKYLPAKLNAEFLTVFRE